jgi:hypothetical protein
MPVMPSARERKKDMKDMIPVLEGGSRQEAWVRFEKRWRKERSRSCDETKQIDSSREIHKILLSYPNPKNVKSATCRRARNRSYMGGGGALQ